MATSRRTAVVMMLCVVLGVLVVGTQGQLLPAPTPAAIVPAAAPGPGPQYNPTGAPGYISYFALSANRAPCPSGTGRSYYSPGCQADPSATPYTRGCLQITRCARG